MKKKSLELVWASLEQRSLFGKSLKIKKQIIQISTGGENGEDKEWNIFYEDIFLPSRNDSSNLSTWNLRKQLDHKQSK